MLKINLICVGNLKDKFFIDACDEYLKRLSRFASIKVIELKECTKYDNTEKIKEAEEEEILKAIKGYCVLLDLKGNDVSSEEFSEKLETISKTNSEISFIIGGSYGVTQKIRNMANEVIKVSKMTFPHRLFRVMLLEQIYRAFTIQFNIGYHK